MRKRFHNLKRPKIRADWSKWTLYNTFRLQRGGIVPRDRDKTFFQQKWQAKAMTRAYHGEQIREGHWSRMFDRRLPSVVPMDPVVLARTDGSDQSAGRGSGLETRMPGRSPLPIPYMSMTYWPTERRLDTAIWRALFASSVRQARQFVVHGGVTVNGKKLRSPGYLLNPGDLFAVDPQRVMYATGARKFSKDSPETTQKEAGKGKANVDSEDLESDRTEGKAETENVVEGEASANEDDADSQDVKEAQNPAATPSQADNASQVADEGTKEQLRDLLNRARQILSEPKDLSGKRKEELREFQRLTKKTLSRFRGTEVKKSDKDSEPIEETVKSLQGTLQEVIAKIPSLKLADTATDEAASEAQDNKEDKDSFDAEKDAKTLHQALQRLRTNPVDASKPYATPWQPREYMSAFAFIPRYLEVNHKICSAVYLRHPVARPGLSEVPTPFTPEAMQLAHNWYLRRR